MSSLNPTVKRPRSVKGKQEPFLAHVWRNRILYAILLPGIIHLIIFKMFPLFGLAIAFQDYNAFQGVLKSPWVGMKHFLQFLSDPYTMVLVRNTVLLALYTLLFSFPIPIIFALFLNEIRWSALKRTVQTFTFFPYFISTAVTVSILYMVLSPDGGLINVFLRWMGLDSVFFMAEPGWFRPLYVTLSVWHSFGYSSIIFLAAMTTIDPHLYESAEIDGASRWSKMFRITLPSITNMIIIMFIVQIGGILSVDLDKILLMYNPSVYATADVIQSYVYRIAFESQGFPNYSFGSAVSFLQSAIAFGLVIVANQMSKKYSESRLF